MGIRGVWSLENVEIKKPQDDWVNIPSVWLANTDFGYSMFQNRWNLTRTNINTGLAYHNPGLTSPFSNHAKSALSSPSHGYWAGGSSTSGYSYASKVAYSTGVHESGLPNLSSPVYESGSISAGEKAYIFAGVWSGSSRSYTQRMFYSNETWAQLPGSNTTHNDWYLSGVNSGSGTGYSVGGYGNTPGTTGKITFANDSWTAIPSGFQRTYYGTGKLQSTTNSWYTGGFINTPSQPYHRVSATHKLTYATDTWARNPTATLPYGINDGASYPYNGSKGALVGGNRQGGDSGMNSAAFTLTFATDTWDATSIAGDSDKYGTESGHNGGCSAAENRGSHAGVDGKRRWSDDAAPAPPFALWAGGYIDASPISRTSQVAKWTYSTGTGEVLPSSNLTERTSSTCSVGAPKAGYWKGGYGYPGPASYWSYTWKCVYSTETSSEIPGLRGGNPGWSSGRTTAGLAVGNTTKGYFGAGSPSYSTPFSNNAISSIPWSTETNTNQPGANLRNPVIFLTGAGSQEVGYAFGGQQSNGNELSYVDKLTYATDVRSNGGNMTTYHYNTGSASSDTASYCFGGAPSPNTKIVEKYVWATDTCSADTALGNDAQNGMNANGKTNAGLLAGGGSKDSTVQKYTYTTSTSSMEPGNMGYGARYMGGASGSNNNGPQGESPVATPTATTMIKFPATLPNFGYQQGSVSGPSGDEVRKIDFATDVGSEVPARLPNARTNHCSFTSELASYISGGSTPSTTNSSQIDKTVYATGTSSNVVNGSSDSLEPGRRRSGGAGNTTNGWTLGGSPAKSKIDKFFYSSETNQGDGTWSNDGPGPNGRNWFSTLSAPSYIYAAGGGDRSNFWRFTYGISSQQEVPGATLLRTPGSPTSYGAEGQIAGLGNKIQGYVGGGKNPGATGGSNPYMQKFVYATETATSLGEILTGSRYGVSNCGDLETGYFLGGSDAGSTGTGKTTKLTYSSDTYAVCPAADTASERTQGQGSGAKSFGIHTSSFPIYI